MGKYKSLLRNIGILTLGQFGTKVLSFLLLPLYTNILTTEEYGAYDLLIMGIGLLCPIVTLNISVSAQRFAMDKDANFGSIVLVGAKYTVLGICWSLGIVFLNHFLRLSEVLYENEVAFIALLSVTFIDIAVVDFAVGAEKIKQVSFSGILSTLMAAMLNIALLVYVKLGITGYYIAHFMGILIQAAFLFVGLGLWRYFKTGSRSSKTEKEMLRFSVPQIANNVSWWINNASDRYVVAFFCGANMNGIYSVGYKIPSMLNMVQGIIGQAWGITAVKNFSQEDEDGFFSKTYEIYNFIMVMVCSGLILFTKAAAGFLFAKDFYQAWRFVPFLLLSSVFGAMAGHLGGVFSARKEGGIFARSTMAGAASNMVMNVLLVPMMGAMGAAVATFVSYFIVWIIRYQYVTKNVRFDVDIKRDMAVYAVLVVQSVLLLSDIEQKLLYLVEVLLLVAIVILNRRNVKVLIDLWEEKKG